MKTKAVRLYGKNDLRLEEFELPPLQPDEIMAEIITDSLCMSTLKAVSNGADHRKVPADIATHPGIVGHEFCGRIAAVGDMWKEQYHVGDKFVIQPNIGDVRAYAPGYSFPWIGGDATYCIFHRQVMDNGSLLSYHGDSYFAGSLVEPLSCIVGAFRAQYHLRDQYSHEHVMGIRQGGAMALLGATGPMGFLAIDLAVHGARRPRHLVVTGRTKEKLELVRRLYPVEEAAKYGVTLHYVNTRDVPQYAQQLRRLLPEQVSGFDDVFVMAADPDMVTQASAMLAQDGCLNFFAGPLDCDFHAPINFFDVHYNVTHIVGTSGGNTEDMKEAIHLIEDGTVHVEKIVSHVLGLGAVVDTTLHLKHIPGGKKLVYTHLDFPLSPLSDLSHLPNATKITTTVEEHGGFWCAEAEQILLNEM